MRIFFAFTTTAVLLALAPIGNPQIQIKTEEHSCEGPIQPGNPSVSKSARLARLEPNEAFEFATD